MLIETKFDHWDRVFTKDQPSVIMQITRTLISCIPPKYPDIVYVCQELDTAKFHKISEKNLHLRGAP